LKALVYTRYGGPEMLEVKEVSKPIPTANEVLIKVFAVSINDWDWGLLQGDFINRIMYGFRKPKIQVLGSDISGQIESIGKNVSRFKPGDQVFGDLSGRWGGFAEYVCADEKAVALKSPNMSFEEAAAIPQAAMLAVQGLIDKGSMAAGQKLLINGAGGGVGTFGLQIAKLHGLEVTVVDSAPKLGMLRSLGADYEIDYRKTDFTNNGIRYDIILDAKTNRSPFNYLRALAPGGRYITVGGSGERLLQLLFSIPWISLFTKKKLKIVMLKVNKDLIYMNELFDAGKIKPVIEGNYSLEDIPGAFRHFSKAEHKGKIVITVTNRLA
jgi:NADPH:quinone reductase-like Zn-dependent oxidoreductase